MFSHCWSWLRCALADMLAAVLLSSKSRISRVLSLKLTGSNFRSLGMLLETIDCAILTALVGLALAPSQPPPLLSLS